MKTRLFTLFLALSANVGLVLGSNSSVDGIWYNFTSISRSAEVTYKGSRGDQYDEYSGSIVIPSSVTYNSVTYSVTSIGDYAFNGCSGLTSITIPNSVTSIGSSAFSGCSGLTSVTIPNSVTSIGGGAFSGCSGLTSISVESGNTHYDSRNSCNAIIETSSNTLIAGCKNTVIPNSVTSIGDYAFSGCSGLTSVTIPNSVTSIGVYAFYGCSGLTSFTIPNSVTSISSSAFSGCSGLTSVTIPNSVTSIGDYAFKGCSGLTSVTIPNSVTSIGDYAFYVCRGLTSITIPNSVTSIGSNAFDGCSGLTSVHISDIAAWCGISYSTVYSNPLYYAKHLYLNENEVTNLIIPNSVTSIGVYAFYGCSSLTSITIPNSVTSISSSAFSGCSGLTSVTIPNSVTSISSSAFNGCSGLTSISVESGNTHYDSRNNCNALIETTSNTLIAGCKNTVIPNSVTSIGSYAFFQCSGLTSITIPNSVTSIGNDAFSGCSGLTSVTIESNNIVGKAYATNYNIGSIFGSQVTEYIIGNSVTSIGDYAFKGCSALTSVTITNSVTSIGNYAFKGCSGLTSVTISNSVTSIGYEAFKSCSSLTSVTIPNSVTSIGHEAFRGCSGLTSVIMGNSVTSIGSSAFYQCIGLTSITIPNSVTSIGEGAFYYCSRLTSVTIGNSVTSIGSSAFRICSGLTSVTIPNSVTSIGDYAFKGCSGLTTIEFNAVNCTSAGSSSYKVFEGCTNITSISFGSGVQNIPSYLCYGLSKLTSITIPDSVISIGNYAFENCNRLDSVIWNARNAEDFNTSPFNSSSGRVKVLILGDSVQHIPANLCNGMTRIKEITIPANVETIGENVFLGCDSLAKVDVYNLATWSNTDFTYTSYPLRTAELFFNGNKPTRIDVPEGVTKVGAYAFMNCPQVTEVLLPPSVTEVGESAFANESRLQTIILDSALTNIGDSAFNNCPYLLTIYANMEFPPLINNSVFANCGDLSGIDCYVPQTSFAFYKKTAVWKDFTLHGVPTYTVSFVDWDSTLIASQTILEGMTATAPADPYRENYTFMGWSPDFSNVQSDLTIVAQYTPNTPSYIEMNEEIKKSNTSKGRKIFENGKLYILLPDGTKYSATGRKIE